MPDRNRADPFRGYNFRVEFDGISKAAFREVSGLTFEVDPVEYREGDEQFLHVRKLFGLRKFTNLQAKRGITTDLQLYRWYHEILMGGARLRDGAIVLELHVAPDDVGKVIGRQGRIARALRTLVRAGAARDDRRVLIEIVE